MGHDGLVLHDEDEICCSKKKLTVLTFTFVSICPGNKQSDFCLNNSYVEQFLSELEEV